ncbi:DNA translocase FtsK 4TM domain-containing protein, partial [Patescibacteria group bacterium]|nr:DNA translocase FtsK 4TM domain-containing protein [Patescibacteria group bacterium]
MPRKRKPGRPPKNKAKARAKAKANEERFGFIFDQKMDPEIFWGIVIVILFLTAALFALSLFGIAGSLGVYIKRGLQIACGYVAYLLPLILAWAGFLLLRKQRNEEYQLKKTSFLGAFLVMISLAGFFHSLSKPEQFFTIAKKGLGGGYVGYLTIFPLEKVVGTWASLLILLAFLGIGIILLFNASPGKLMEIAAQFKRFCLRLVDKVTKREAIRKAGLRVKGLGEDKKEQDNGLREVNSDETEGGRRKFPSLSFGRNKTEEKDVPDSSPVQTSGGDDNFKPFGLDLLDSRHGKPVSGDIRTNARIIEETLKSFGIDVAMEEVNIGPTVTQYTFKPNSGVKVSQITTLQNDLSLALAAHPLRIEAPIPGRSLVGVEIPNRKVALVRLREVLASSEFKNNFGGLRVALGRNVAGDAVVVDITKMPHLLIAGATGSGKSVAIHTLITSLLYQNSPKDLKFIFVDPKKVELTCYNGIPHLLTPVITEVDKTINALKWSVAEMERRFKLLSESGKRDIGSYNKSYPTQRLPNIVMVIDELADLMAVAAGDVEAAVVRLAQMSRAVGIHLVLA